MPPLLARQYRLFRDDKQQPIGLALWAKVGPEVEERLAGGGANRMRPDDWSSGPLVWLIDLIAPFGRQDEMLNELKETALKGVTFRFLRTTPEGKREIMTINPDDAG